MTANTAKHANASNRPTSDNLLIINAIPEIVLILIELIDLMYGVFNGKVAQVGQVGRAQSMEMTKG